MDRIYESLERIKVLWRKLEEQRQGTAEYAALMTEIRAASDQYRALVDTNKTPSTRRTTTPTK